jgi:hypothetical protein
MKEFRRAASCLHEKEDNLWGVLLMSGHLTKSDPEENIVNSIEGFGWTDAEGTITSAR